MKIFQFAIIWHPNEEQKKTGERSKILAGIRTVLAVDQNSALLLAGRELPEEYLNQLEQIEIAVRPF